MNINKDYMSIMRAGARIERAHYRKEIESGFTMFYALAIGAGVVLLAALIN